MLIDETYGEVKIMTQSVVNNIFPSCDTGWQIGPLKCTCNQPIERDEANAITLPPGTRLKVNVYQRGILIEETNSCPSCDHPHILSLFVLDALTRAGFDTIMGNIESLLSRVTLSHHCLLHQVLHIHVN